MSDGFSESFIEQVATDWCNELGYEYAFDSEIAFDGSFRMLASLWNSLLPKLMRGKVRVKL